MDLNKKLNNWHILGLLIFGLIYIVGLITLPIGINIDWNIFLIGISICSLIAIPIVFINNSNLSKYIKLIVWLLCVCLVSMCWFLMQSILVVHLNGERKIYKQEIKYVTKLKGTKQGTGCKIFAKWKEKQSNVWLEYCVSNDIYEYFVRNKLLHATIQTKNNNFGVLVENVTFNLE